MVVKNRILNTSYFLNFHCLLSLEDRHLQFIFSLSTFQIFNGSLNFTENDKRRGSEKQEVKEKDTSKVTPPVPSKRGDFFNLRCPRNMKLFTEMLKKKKPLSSRKVAEQGLEPRRWATEADPLRKTNKQTKNL